MKALILLVAASIALAQKPLDKNWVLTFADEFNGPELDLAKWSPHEPGGQAHEAHPEAITLSGGQLHVTARRVSKGFIPGIVTTFGTFAQRYGRFEIRCRVPAGRGLRAIVSLRPVPLAPLPAIDLLEVNGATPSAISFGNNWGTEQTRRSFEDSFPAPDLSAGFHTIAIEWDENKILWSIDGKDKFQSLDGVPRQSMFLSLELAVGGAVDSTAFPASFDIDYIRIYQPK